MSELDIEEGSEIEAARTGATMRRHKSPQGYGTPWDLIRACQVFFRRRVLWDLAANEGNAKAERFITKEQDSLSMSWGALARGRSDMLWLNPPFSDIAPWARKCAQEGMSGAPILLLTPASIGSNWFREHVFGKAAVFALNGRITFTGATQPYPKDCIISAFGLQMGPGFSVWQWGKDVPGGGE